jgi:hypothetical protein
VWRMGSVGDGREGGIVGGVGEVRTVGEPRGQYMATRKEGRRLLRARLGQECFEFG